MKPSPHVQYSSTLVVKIKKRYWEGTISGNNYGTKRRPCAGECYVDGYEPSSCNT